MDSVLIFDFGSQYTQLIARRVREAGVYTEIVPGDMAVTPAMLGGYKGLILSGSPSSVYEDGAPRVDRQVYDCGLPVLGICYGAQRMTQDGGGRVQPLPDREYGRRPVRVLKAHPLFEGVAATFSSWMSHGDSIEALAPGFETLAVSDNDIPAAIRHRSKPLLGIQFHPEVSHCESGNLMLANFVRRVCGCRPEWTMARYVEAEAQAIRARVGDRPVLLLISGGVDSTVAGALLLKILPQAQVHLMYIDTGLMRQRETVEVTAILERLGALHLHIVDAAADFLAALAGKIEPEAKRRAIGDMFISVQEKAVAGLGLSDYYLAQGTLYTDLIESGKGVGQKAHVIKSHHNVRSPLVEAKRAEGRIVEPLDRLYKDEVRALGRVLGLSEPVVSRHPFPGPGLGVRVLGEVSREKCDILRAADDIFITELRERGLYDQIWQAFAVLLPVRSVGVAGDVRRYGWTVALRAVASSDGMTADVFDFPMKDLREISALITNRVPEVGRVVYDISSKPPATIEWE
ncbi:MAG: GMP synthetase [Spirochaetes bacterium GWD1_61_31]|nr:MAG: GMP synthetase [Spirochaetes bacterium GWB1_60_80]OHD30593.1 MAG: GMP synthetase [Spirochaetes bacterium GWC1_61_12]OHD34862.1 MAG: GMP synthetase [Spirochaetes bacterium GWD1_61_31]OHD46708.1 MAG: GMP synthetase [Spirochaetes bacterium GWE1_60_18]OHD60336.1 MAG: GMP synthetase [Spirochaetes bacterium GWF1_60_12]HAP44238.1 glutamine-hydrolyzing GMP synthase [Spirochaetaceae bacterium]